MGINSFIDWSACLFFFFFLSFFLVHPSATWFCPTQNESNQEPNKKNSIRCEWLNVMWYVLWAVSPSGDQLQYETIITSHLIWMTESHSHMLLPLCSTVMAASQLSASPLLALLKLDSYLGSPLQNLI